MTSCDILFCLRSYNDIDHAVPIIYKLKKEKDDILIQCMVHSSKYEGSDNYLIQYIKSLEVPVEHILEYFYFGKVNIITYLKIRKKIKEIKRFLLFRKLMNRFVFNPIDEKLNKLENNLNPNKIIKKNFAYKNKGLIVFDHKFVEKYKKLCICAKNKGLKTIAIPHGGGMGIEEITNYSKKKSKDEFFDYIIFENRFKAKRGIIEGWCLKDNAKVFGPTRFSGEWVKHLRTLLPEVHLPIAEKKFKIAFMMSKPKTLNQEKIDETIEMLGQVKKVCLLLKPHSRGMQYNKDLPGNVYIVDNSTPSPNIIDWADLTLFTSSSIILDNLQLDKPVLFLKYAVPHRDLIFERYVKSWTVNNLNELKERINSFIKNKKLRTYTKEERELLIKNYLELDGKDVLGKYIRFLLCCLNHTKPSS